LSPPEQRGARRTQAADPLLPGGRAGMAAAV